MNTLINSKAAHRRFRTVAAPVTLALALPCIAGVTSASASTPDVSCPGYAAVNYQPALTSNPGMVSISVNGVHGPCTSTDTTLTSGTSKGTLQSDALTCTSGTDTGTETFTWNNGQTSTVSLTATISQNLAGATIVTAKGTVTAGEFLGDTVSGVYTRYATVPLQCIVPPSLTSLAGTAPGVSVSGGLQLLQFFPASRPAS